MAAVIAHYLLCILEAKYGKIKNCLSQYDDTFSPLRPKDTKKNNNQRIHFVSSCLCGNTFSAAGGVELGK